jgi:hypothetical protein
MRYRQISLRGRVRAPRPPAPKDARRPACIRLAHAGGPPEPRPPARRGRNSPRRRLLRQIARAAPRCRPPRRSSARRRTQVRVWPCPPAPVPDLMDPATAPATTAHASSTNTSASTPARYSRPPTSKPAPRIPGSPMSNRETSLNRADTINPRTTPPWGYPVIENSPLDRDAHAKLAFSPTPLLQFSVCPGPEPWFPGVRSKAAGSKL